MIIREWLISYRVVLFRDVQFCSFYCESEIEPLSLEILSPRRCGWTHASRSGLEANRI